MQNGHFGIMVDCSRNAVLTVDGVKRLITVMKKMGYNMLMLYTEDTYEVEGHERFGYLRGRYTKEELKELVTYGEANDVELIPCIQTLAHLQAIFRYPEYKDISDMDDILLAEDPRTYELIDSMFQTLRECYNTDRIHIGMDEAHNVGKGKYRDIHGDVPRFEILKRHLEKVASIAEKYGFRPMMWSDMFFRLATNGEYYTDDPTVISSEIADCVPSNVDLVYWDYYQDKKEKYDNMIEAHKHFNNTTWFAGGTITWEGLSPYNQISINRMTLAMKSCRENGVKDLFFTAWGDNGGECSIFAVLPALFYIAEVYRGNEDEAKIKQKFEELFGIAFDDFIKLDHPNLINESYSLWASSNNRALMYNDLFAGIFDPLIADIPNLEQHFKSVAAELAPLCNNAEYGYLFRSSAALCEFLALKAELGVLIRKAYKANDRVALTALCERISEAENALDTFYHSYRSAWLHDKKGSGLEVQDLRIGGLKLRLTDCRMRICEYLNGEISQIDDLEQELVKTQPYLTGFWQGIVSANNI